MKLQDTILTKEQKKKTDGVKKTSKCRPLLRSSFLSKNKSFPSNTHIFAKGEKPAVILNTTTNMSVCVSDTPALDFRSDSNYPKSAIKIRPLQEKIPTKVSYANLYFDEFSRPTSRQNLLTLLAKPSEKISPEQARRDPKNGAWTFKPDTEDDLLAHVEYGLAEHIESFNEIDSSEAILRSIDVYCLGKQWMFHVGQEKGEVLKGFLRECIEAFLRSTTARTDPMFVLVELGSYCGYSAILLAKSVREMYPNLKFHLYSLETNKKFVKISKRMVQLAKLDSYVTIIRNDLKKQSLNKTLMEHLPKPKIDYLLLDHDKDVYLSNLKEMEHSGFIQKGTHIAADNVIFSPLLKPYREYVAKLAEKAIVSTTMVEQKLEYSDSRQNLLDGIGKKDFVWICLVLPIIRSRSAFSPFL